MRFTTSGRLLGFVFFLHACVGAAVGLSVDEAHYLLYALHPALSYFDHPPLVGWVQWPLVALGAPVAVLRLIPGLLWLATAFGVYRLTLLLFAHGAAQVQRGASELACALPKHAEKTQAQRAGLWALAALLLAPVLHVLGIGLLPDTLLMALSVALMAQTMRLMDAQLAKRPAPWLLLGALLGLAGLAKYTAIFTAIAVAACLLHAHGWRLLRNPWLWACTALALLLVLPVLVWNVQNGWISFVYQAKHGSGGAWELAHVLRFLLTQLISYGALLLWGLYGLYGLCGSRALVAPQQRVLLLFFAIPFVVFAAMAGGGSSLPHWTAPAWVALAPFAGLGLARFWSAAQRAGRALLLGLLFVQLLACTALLGLMLSAGQPWFASKEGNPFADLHGWEAAGQRARYLARNHRLTAVAVQNWTLASRIGWAARQIPVHVLQDRYDQFDMWSGDLTPDTRVLLLDWSQMPFPLPVGAGKFASCQWLDSQEVQRWGTPVSQFSFYSCTGWQGAPKRWPPAKTSPTAP